MMSGSKKIGQGNSVTQKQTRTNAPAAQGTHWGGEIEPVFPPQFRLAQKRVGWFTVPVP